MKWSTCSALTQVIPELANEAVEYVASSIDALPSASPNQYSFIIIVLDATLDEANMKPTREALKKVGDEVFYPVVRGGGGEGCYQPSWLVFEKCNSFTQHR